MSAIAPTGPRAAGVHWDLASIVADAATARTQLDDVLGRCDAFAERHRGGVSTLTSVELGEALADLSVIENLLGRIGSYVSLRRSVDVNDDEARDLETVVEQAYVRAANTLRFFELEWIAVDDDLAATLAAAPEVARDRHHLESLRRYRPHRLSEPEERMLAERAPAAVTAWQNLFEQTTANLEVRFDAGEGVRDHTLDEILAYMYTPDREVRSGALDALYATLEPLTPVLAHCYDSLVGDRLVDDRLRSYDGPMAQRHLSNELPPEAVDAMLDAIERRYDIAQRWFRRKAELLGIEKLRLSDQYAPIGEGRTVPYEESRAIVRDAFARFSPQVEELTERFFDERRVDAEPRAGKRGGAFCASVAQDAQPFVLLNYTERLRDVMTMAHELGHGMHFALSAEHQTALSFHTGIALAEVPSTFAELVVFNRLMEIEKDPEVRATLARGEVESGFATVFRQTMMVRYELDAYGTRAGGRALTPDRLSEFWWARNSAYYGDSVELPEGYRRGWSYIPHFINTRFYTYAYAFAHLVSLALYARWRADGDAFVAPYVEFLSRGASAAPAEQLQALGVDILDAATWDLGLGEMERMLELALS